MTNVARAPFESSPEIAQPPCERTGAPTGAIDEAGGNSAPRPVSDSTLDAASGRQHVVPSSRAYVGDPAGAECRSPGRTAIQRYASYEPGVQARVLTPIAFQALIATIRLTSAAISSSVRWRATAS